MYDFLFDPQDTEMLLLCLIFSYDSSYSFI